MNKTENYKKIAIECAVCKTKFELWITMANYTPEVEEHVRSNFYKFCPVCKTLEELDKKNR